MCGVECKAAARRGSRAQPLWPAPPSAAQEAEEDSADEEGYHDAPAVYVGGEPAALDPASRPACLRCRGAMSYVGHVDSDVFSDELPEDSTVHLFYCHDDAVQCCLAQPLLDVPPQQPPAH